MFQIKRTDDAKETWQSIVYLDDSMEAVLLQGIFVIKINQICSNENHGSCP